jgi:hypothetical protein
MHDGPHLFLVNALRDEHGLHSNLQREQSHKDHRSNIVAPAVAVLALRRGLARGTFCMALAVCARQIHERRTLPSWVCSLTVTGFVRKKIQTDSKKELALAVLWDLTQGQGGAFCAF